MARSWPLVEAGPTGKNESRRLRIRAAIAMSARICATSSTTLNGLVTTTSTPPRRARTCVCSSSSLETRMNGVDAMAGG